MNATLFTSHNLSRSDISVRYVFQKMFSPKGTLVADESPNDFGKNH
ncbi:cyclic diguanylate phosphodiesterase (EAL) domain-containing protein [Klebsiella oxytoca]|nr:cyclic diguanylate phosphodiesterase (EAL) domain-containing protein [Klebsiella oxytoca]